MAKLEFTKVNLEQFKSVRNTSYDLAERTDIVGRNGSGKTTIGTALTLPFTGKDLNGKSNPEIHPDFMDESEPHITIEGTIDGKPISLEMIQKDTRTKKQRESGALPKIANKYKINGVDKSATAFKADLAERGIDLDIYDQLSNINSFYGLKEADKRKVVFEMASDISDAEVAKTLGKDADIVLRELETYKMDEIEALAKQNRKRARERLDALPEQITGLERGKPEMEDDTDLLMARRQRLEQQIEIHEANAKALSEKDSTSMTQRLSAINVRQMELVSNANSARIARINEAKSNVRILEWELKLATSNLNTKQRLVKDLKEELSLKSDESASTLNAIRKAKEAVFPESETICPTCGQLLPKENIEKMTQTWAEHQNAHVKELEEKHKLQTSRLTELEQRIYEEEHGDNMESCRSEFQKASDALNDADKALMLLEEEPRIQGWDIPEWNELEEESKLIKEEMANASANKQRRIDELTAVASLRAEIADIDRELGKVETIKHIDSQIAELKNEQRQAAQNEADSERILGQIAAVNQKKNELLSESVNEKFADFIKFKLFDTLKNGEVKDCCIPLIQNEHGEWKELGKTANTALEMRAKLAILDGFQNFHDMHVPIIVDGASEIDKDNKKRIALGTQVIFLSVVSGMELTITKI